MAVDGRSVAGPVQGSPPNRCISTCACRPVAVFRQALADGHSAFVYAYEGKLAIGPEKANRRALPAPGRRRAGRRGSVRSPCRDGPARFLLLAARPLGEPVVQYGPFVMNTREEIEQAIADYRANRLA
jgi:redox-sensitive bicupin YhaK (pirin superfamily)